MEMQPFDGGPYVVVQEFYPLDEIVPPNPQEPYEWRVQLARLPLSNGQDKQKATGVIAVTFSYRPIRYFDEIRHCVASARSFREIRSKFLIHDHELGGPDCHLPVSPPVEILDYLPNLDETQSEGALRLCEAGYNFVDYDLNWLFESLEEQGVNALEVAKNASESSASQHGTVKAAMKLARDRRIQGLG